LRSHRLINTTATLYLPLSPTPPFLLSFDPVNSQAKTLTQTSQVPMNAGIQNLVISLGVMQVARKIPFDEPGVLNYVRVGYVVCQLVVLGVYYFISYKIKQKKRPNSPQIRGTAECNDARAG